jgi:hypothetical protein
MKIAKNNEIWKDIAGYEKMYQVSNLGRIRSLPRRDKRNRFWNGNILKSQVNKYGYLSVKLTKDGKSKRYMVHRLVATAFLPNQNHCKEINHKDENKQNNSVDNLEWCTRSYNVTYGSLNEDFRKRRVSGERGGRSVLTKEQVLEIRRKYVKGSRHYGLSALSKEYGVCISQIGNIVRFESWNPKYI